MEIAKLIVNFTGLLVIPVAWLVFHEIKEIWKSRDRDKERLAELLDKYVRREDCLVTRGKNDRKMDTLCEKLDQSNSLLDQHMGYHKGKENGK